MMPRKNSKPTQEQAKLDACLQKRGMKLTSADIHSGRKAKTAARREVTRLAMGQDLEW